MAAAQTSPLVITIPKINVQQMQVSLVGDSPLISHAWSEKAKKQMLDKQMKKAKTAKEAKDPWLDFCDSLYWLTERPAKPTEKEIAKARFGFPCVAFKAAAVGACRFADGIKMTEARGAFHVIGEHAHIEGAAPIMREDMVRIAMGTADIRFRGEFKEWKTTLTVSYNADALSPEQIVNLFNVAGFGVGVGEWRPEKDGSYGRFHVG
jgi:hypothetical protein